MNKRKVKQVVLPLLTAFIWGSAFVAQTIGAESIDGFTYSAARAYPAVIALSLVLLITRRAKPEERYTPAQRRELLVGGLVCGVFLAFSTNIQQFALTETGAGKAGFITALYIVLVPLFGVFLGKRASRRLVLCVAIAVAGLYLLSIKSGEGLSGMGRGDFLVLCSAFGFAGHILVVDHFVQKVDGIALSCVQFTVMAILSTICALLFETIDLAAIAACAGSILYVGILSSAVGYTLQIIAQKDGDPTVVSLLLSLESFFAVVCGAVVLHERMSAREYLGCALMLTAVILSQLPEKNRTAEK